MDERWRETLKITSLESRNYISKQISQVVKDDRQVVSDQFEILDESKSFYENKKKSFYEDEKETLLNQRFLWLNLKK